MTELSLLATFFLFVMGVILAAGYVVMARLRPAGDSPADELADGSAAAAGPRVVMSESVDSEGFGAIVRIFQLVGEAIPSARSANNPLRARLLQAGYRLPAAVSIFYGIKCAAGLGCSVLVSWAAAAFDASPFLPAFCAIAFGYMIPDRVLDRVVKSRGFRLRHALPAALDMLVLAVEAGQSLDQAIAATSRGLKNTSPDLAAELTQLHLEARATNNRVEALRNLAIRNKEPELKKFTSLLIDTDRFGTSVGPALRDHAKYLRIRFRQQAQEAARKVGVKLIFPVFFLIFPSVILITLGPAVIMIFTQLRVMVGN